MKGKTMPKVLLRIIFLPIVVCVVLFRWSRKIVRFVFLNPWCFIPMGVALIGVIFVFYWLYVFDLFGVCANDFLGRGALGDSFGLATSFFTALAFLGTLYAIYLQSKQLEEARRNYGLEQLPMLAIKKLTGVFTLSENVKEDKVALQIHIRGQEQNLSNTNALNVVRKVSIRLPAVPGFFDKGALSNPISVLPPHEEKEMGVSIRFYDYKLMDDIVKSLKQNNDDSNHLQVCVEKMYSNLLGAYGYVKQLYSVEMSCSEQGKFIDWLRKSSEYFGRHADHGSIARYFKENKLLISLTFKPIPFKFIAEPSSRTEFMRFIGKDDIGFVSWVFRLYNCSAWEF